ncbi:MULTISPECIES: hypothetical protein [unclassified Streptomyces]|uniref:hypothetical protein n=1 Tax=unclassified Streptomyces TaxID=2593676 RepID=UPI0009395C3A|nr:hypothetical protein [Streptomyces sp. CB01883]OKJ87269.1 hypothetical protein AMK32_08500 [Streptomyces sp. CB01883]
MITITAADVEQAESQAAAAERERVALELELKAKPFSEITGRKLTDASMQAAQLAARATTLREQHEREVAAKRESREELEKAAAKDVVAAGKDLKAARGRLEDAAEAAQRALVELMRQAEAYDVVVGQHADVLVGRGLDLGGESGGGRSFDGASVKVRGTVYESAGAGAVLVHVAHRVAEARLPYPNHMVGILEYNCGRLVPEERGDGLLSGLSRVEPVVYPEVPPLRSAMQG